MTLGCPQSANKDFTIVFYRRVRSDAPWADTSDWDAVERVVAELKTELAGFGVDLACEEDPENEILIRGYGDVLNSIRLRYPAGGFGNTCLGHVIGQSAQRDLAADIRRGINRILFAPETIEPQGSDKVVCHNCGCGC